MIGGERMVPLHAWKLCVRGGGGVSLGGPHNQVEYLCTYVAATFWKNRQLSFAKKLEILVNTDYVRTVEQIL